MRNYLNTNFLAPAVLTAGFFLYWLLIQYIHHDLVWDELVSLKNFVLVDVITTATHYPDVNNHLFFNLLNNFYCKMIGIGDVYEAMDHIALVRLYTTVITLVTLMYVFLIGKKFINQTAGFMAVIILLTTIPFLNFTLQLRGYSLSIAFLATSIYYLLSLEKKRKWPTIFLAIFSIFGLLYTIPSNVYFGISLGTIYLIKWIVMLRKNEYDWQTALKSQNFMILIVISVGALFAFLSYLPILEDLLNERHLQQLKGKSFYMHNLKETFPLVITYIFSYRILFLLPYAPFIVHLFKGIRKSTIDRNSYIAIIMLAIMLLSFSICLIRGDKPHQRTFVPLTVCFSIFTAIAIEHYITRFKETRWKDMIVFSTVFIYCTGSYFFCDFLRQKELNKAIIDGEKVYNMFYNFYQSEKYGSKYLEPLIDEASKTNYPILMAREIDRVFEGEYLMKHGLAYSATVWSKRTAAENKAGYTYKTLLEFSDGMGAKPKYEMIAFPPSISNDAKMVIPLFGFLIQQGKIDQNDPKFYVLTSSPRWFEGVMRESLTDFKYTRINRELNYHNIYLVSR